MKIIYYYYLLLLLHNRSSCSMYSTRSYLLLSNSFYSCTAPGSLFLATIHSLTPLDT